MITRDLLKSTLTVILRYDIDNKIALDIVKVIDEPNSVSAVLMHDIILALHWSAPDKFSKLLSRWLDEYESYIGDNAFRVFFVRYFLMRDNCNEK